MLTKGRHKYIRNFEAGEVEELYNLDTDPEELDNLALKTDHVKQLGRLRTQTIEELRRTAAKMVETLPNVGGPHAPRR